MIVAAYALQRCGVMMTSDWRQRDRGSKKQEGAGVEEPSRRYHSFVYCKDRNDRQGERQRTQLRGRSPELGGQSQRGAGFCQGEFSESHCTCRTYMCTVCYPPPNSKSTHHPVLPLYRSFGKPTGASYTMRVPTKDQDLPPAPAKTGLQN